MEKYKTLGRSGLRVSPLCLGSMTLGTDWGWGADEKESENIIRGYMEAGGNFIDTASVYTNGHSETIIGDVVGSQSSLRTRMVIGTKFSANIYPGDPNGGGTGAKAIIESCHQSLRRLQTDYIDLFSIHQWDWNTPFEETMRTLNSLVISGKVRYIGVSYAPAWKIAQVQTMAELKDWAPFVGLQIEYSLLQRSVEDELLPMAAELGLGVTPWSPLKGGLLSGKYDRSSGNQSSGTRFGDTGRKATLSDKEVAILEELRKVSVTHGSTVAAVALSWVVGRPGVVSTIIGVRKREQLEQNLAALEVKLSSEEIKALDDVSAPAASFVNSYGEAAKMFHHGGIEVNGYRPAVLPLTKDMVAGKY